MASDFQLATQGALGRFDFNITSKALSNLVKTKGLLKTEISKLKCDKKGTILP